MKMIGPHSAVGLLFSKSCGCAYKVEYDIMILNEGSFSYIMASLAYIIICDFFLFQHRSIQVMCPLLEIFHVYRPLWFRESRMIHYFLPEGTCKLCRKIIFCSFMLTSTTPDRYFPNLFSMRPGAYELGFKKSCFWCEV